MDRPTAGALNRAVDEAFVAAFRTVVLVAAGLALASAVTAALTIEVGSQRRARVVESPRLIDGRDET
jgi:hypothetical protein